MNLLTKLFNRKAKESKVGGMEDYMSLVRVYFQASIAAQVGIANLAMFPDLRMFKTTLHVPTQGNKLGVGEKAHCRKMMKEIYHTDDGFFKEIDQSIRHNCKRITDVQAHSISELHTRPDDAHGQSDEVQAPCAVLLQEDHLCDDGENGSGHLYEEQFQGPERHQVGDEHPQVQYPSQFLPEMDYRFRLSGGDACQKGTCAIKGRGRSR